LAASLNAFAASETYSFDSSRVPKASSSGLIAAHVVSLSGEPPRSRVVLSVFENIDKARAAYSSPAYLDARKISDKYELAASFALRQLF
jgi:Domain of unknown function (DUF1330)